MKTLVFASNNAKKIKEVQELLPQYNIKGLTDIGCLEDIPETAETFEGNAFLKASYVFDKYGFPCFADDSGLVVNSLNGEPGIYSARYAADENNGVKSDEKNIQKVLRNLKGKTDTTAYFITLICYYDGKNTHYFDGKIDGEITHELRGDNGFGYDPIFVPFGYEKTFAELTSDEKNANSHRSIAVKKLATFLARA